MLSDVVDVGLLPQQLRAMFKIDTDGKAVNGLAIGKRDYMGSY